MTWFRRERIGRASIKESLDNLPSGICFADQSGLVILSNRQMYRLCYTLMGVDLQHISELLDALEKPQAGIQSVGADTNVYRFPEGKVWKFTQSSITDADGNAYTQVLAVDVTALYEKEDELQQENRRLEEVNARARNLYAQLDNIVREEENFAVKTHVHDEMGELLGLTRNMLTQRELPPERLKALGKRWEHIGDTLGAVGKQDGDAFDSDKTLAELTEGIAGIGVALHVRGEFPQKSGAAYLLTAAVRECAINTVRHAKGSEMTVELTKTPHALTASITNDGLAPAGEVIEGGGLSALRRRIEGTGGSMQVESTPRFRLVITLPGKEETP
ncbi:MAG: hypothetical protein MR999_04290 [Flintibacter sp.]|uniref:PAS domain-containing sensor histidine kinase n=1 Tax=Eubacteriales TaxID=186802 RepID=UPI00258B713F|nr:MULTISPECIES: hypothetical protein [Eubacteriales]MCI6398567.1 hypothetical protein [Lawsonibacter sp.]MCI7158627.1 hypothetical protein [Flintibacter sp.]MDY2977845.1 hypothetical protein [Oscillospiraceae bacterium]